MDDAIISVPVWETTITADSAGIPEAPTEPKPGLIQGPEPTTDERSVMANIPLHSEPDAVLNLIGDLHLENGVLVIGDVDIAKKLAAVAGLTFGGRQFGFLHVVFTKATVEVTTSDQSFGGAFKEASEP